MHKFVFCIPLAVGITFGAPLSAQQAYFPNPQYFAVPGSNQSAGGYQQPLRWRPLEAESEQTVSDSDGWTSQGGSPSFDYTDEPLGLPRGTYRRIEQRHTITPHLEGYRFRPIEPDEQERNRQRNESSAQSHRDDTSSPASIYDNHTQGYQQGIRRPTVKFRPDTRLDAKARGTQSRYAFPMGSSGPMFRPR
jgi:hypothetical protein